MQDAQSVSAKVLLQRDQILASFVEKCGNLIGRIQRSTRDNQQITNLLRVIGVVEHRIPEDSFQRRVDINEPVVPIGKDLVSACRFSHFRSPL